MGVDCRMAVVALVETTSGTLHDPAVGVSEVLLRALFGHPECPLVARPTFGLAILVTRRALVILAATPGRVPFALAAPQTRACGPDALQALLTTQDLGGDVQFRFVSLSRVGGARLVQQGRNLLLQLGFGFQHALVAHGFVA